MIEIHESVGNGSISHGEFETTEDAEEFIMNRVISELSETVYDEEVYGEMMQNKVSYYSIDLDN